jgi:hypothetical protein
MTLEEALIIVGHLPTTADLDLRQTVAIRVLCQHLTLAYTETPATARTARRRRNDRLAAADGHGRCRPAGGCRGASTGHACQARSQARGQALRVDRRSFADAALKGEPGLRVHQPGASKIGEGRRVPPAGNLAPRGALSR